MGPSEAFDPEQGVNTSVYAIQNHLALEVVAHLVSDGAPILFQGGTALHVKLGDRTRFSIDLDVRTTDPPAVHRSLRGFVSRFQRSDIQLEEPPRELQIDGVRHTLLFNLARDQVTAAPLRILVEVVESDRLDRYAEALGIRADGFDWGVRTLAPTLEGFAAQKFAVVGPETIGKRVGRNETNARANQGVCKQVYDLTQLLRRDLDGSQVLRAYRREVEEANRLRKTSFVVDDVLQDASRLLRALKEPRPDGPENLHAYALWSGYDDSRRWIRDREAWTPSAYRISGGVLHRVAQELLQGRLRWGLVGRPIVEARVPDSLAAGLSAELDSGREWVASDGFAGDLRVAWAWSPERYW